MARNEKTVSDAAGTETNNVLEMLKIDLGINHTLRDLYFNNLIAGCNSELAGYDEQVNKAVDEESERLAKSLVSDLKTDPSIPKSNRANRHYKASFFMKKYGERSKNRGYVIANRKYQLTHLLEFGHATRSGGRTKAYPHWDEANRKAQDLTIRIRKRIEGEMK